MIAVWDVLRTVLTVTGAFAMLGVAWVVLSARRIRARREAADAEYAATLDVDALLRAWAAEARPDHTDSRQP